MNSEAKQKVKKLVMSALSIWAFMIVFFLLLNAGSYYLHYPIDIREVVSVGYFNSAASHYGKTSNLTNNMASICGLEDSQREKIECVYDLSMRFFKYNETIAESLDGISLSSPEDIFIYGHVCRGWSVFYKSVLDIMGIESEFVFAPDHVFLIVKPESNEADWRYALLDMDVLRFY